MTEPTDEAPSLIDSVRERERDERDSQLAEELQQTERIADVLSSEDEPDDAPTSN